MKRELTFQSWIVVTMLVAMVSMGVAGEKSSNYHILNPAPLPVSSSLGVLDTLGWGEYIDKGSFQYYEGDTIATWFEPAGPCSLIAVRMLWHKDTELGSVNLDIWSTDYYGESSHDSTYEGGTGWLGGYCGTVDPWQPGNFFGRSPLKENLWGSMTVMITATTVDPNWMEISLEPFGFVDVGEEPFIVAIEATGKRLICYHTEETLPYHTFKYYADPAHCGDACDGCGGWLLRSSTMYVQAVVSYYANSAPIIKNVTTFPNTYSTAFTVTADITDKDAINPDQAGVASAYLHYSTDGGSYDSTAMSGPSTGGVFTADMSGFAAGETISYFVSATDPPGLRREVPPLSFIIKTPENPNADILLVDDNGFFDDYLKEALGDLGRQYQFWSVRDENGLDASVTGYGWSTAVVYSWGARTIPTRGYSGNPWAEFLDNGGNLLYIDQDYFYGNSEDEYPSFSSGDMAYDYFGIESGHNDPGENIDYMFYGMTDDVISGPFGTNPIDLMWWRLKGREGSNWPDYTYARDVATTIFYGESGEPSGLRYDSGTFKTVHLPFLLGSAVTEDTTRSPKVDTLLARVFEWFGTTSSVEPDDQITPITYHLSQNYPNPFNPQTTIEYSVAYAGRVEILVFNTLGQRVAQLVDTHQNPGSYRANWEPKDLASGIYFYRLYAGDFTMVKKMLFMK